MDSQKIKLKEIHSNFNQKMAELLNRKKKLIDDFRDRLKNRKINKLREELMQK